MNINKDNYKQFSFFVLILIGISALLTYLIRIIVNQCGVIIPFYIELPSIPAIYALLFYFFDNFLWKNILFKKLGIIIADDLNGKWAGTIQSSYNNFKSNIYAELNITQSATQLKICGVFGESKSISIQESFGKSEIDNKVALFYFYRNEPNYDAANSMVTHDGSAKLVYNKEDDSLNGYYYSGKERNNYGTINVKRV